jgi:hypothetical protein
MFLIIFEDHHHHHHAHAIDQDSIATILYQSKLQARPILFVMSADKTFDRPSPNTQNQVHYLHRSTSDE